MIRRAHASDISRVAALYHAVWHETQTPFMPHAEIIRERMGRHHKAEIMEQVAGEHGQIDLPFRCMTKVLTI